MMMMPLNAKSKQLTEAGTKQQMEVVDLELAGKIKRMNER